MDRSAELKAVIKTITECRKEVDAIRGDIVSPEWKKVKDSLTSAISFLNRANRQLTELIPMEGQISLFDYLESETGFKESR